MLQFLPVNESQFVNRLQAHADIVGHCKHGHQIKVLMNQTEPQVPDLTDAHTLGIFSVDMEATSIFAVFPIKNLHKGGFSSAVFAYQSMGLALSDFKVHIIQGDHAWKIFRNEACLDNDILIAVSCSTHFLPSHRMNKGC